MRVVFEEPKVKLGDVLATMLLLGVLSMFVACTIDIFSRKDDVVVDENYKGKYIKVLHYTFFNRDSAYQYYYQPKEVTVKVLGVNSSNDIEILDGKYHEIVRKNSLEKKYKENQTIKLLKTFYPSVGYTDIYYKGKYTKK
jgi:hypothetical protein